MKYLIEDEDKTGFPFIIHFYYENVSEIGEIEVYRTGKFYFKDYNFNSGMNVADFVKMMKTVKKELRKQKIRTWLKNS